MLADRIKLIAQQTLEKRAAGKMMEVGFHKLEQDGQPVIKTTRGLVYMPDCAAYRDIISNGTPEEQAALVQKFKLNLGPGIHFKSCEAFIVEK